LRRDPAPPKEKKMNPFKVELLHWRRGHCCVTITKAGRVDREIDCRSYRQGRGVADQEARKLGLTSYTETRLRGGVKP